MAEDYKTREFLEQHPELIPQVESITPQIVDKVTRGANVVNGWHSSMPGAPTASEEEKEALVADVAGTRAGGARRTWVRGLPGSARTSAVGQKGDVQGPVSAFLGITSAPC